MEISRHAVVRAMACAIVALLVLSYLGQVSKYVLGHPTLFGLVDFFYVDEEGNLPTIYQFLALLMCSIVIAVTPHDSYRGHWKWLSIIFAYLAFDEAAGIHELTIQPLWRVLGDMEGSIWASKWVIVGLIAVAAVGLAYLKFLFHLERREQVQVVLAAALFVGGAAGVEMLTGVFVVDSSQAGFKDNLLYASVAHIEEGMEMLGILVFLDFLLRRSGDIVIAARKGERAGDAVHDAAPDRDATVPAGAFRPPPSTAAGTASRVAVRR